MNKDAILSPCGTYRYLLQRSWNPALEAVCFVMLNPSTADAEQDDPTIRKCIGFAQRLGFGQLEVVNLYAYRATNPDDMLDSAAAGIRIEGPENERVVADSVKVCHEVICAWGTHRAAQFAGPAMLAYLRRLGAKPKALRLTDKGFPGHPLYIPYAAKPVPYGHDAAGERK